MKYIGFVIIGSAFLIASCSVNKTQAPDGKIPVILDTDTNNELDDQHALAYLLFNGSAFDLEGVTVNATRSGGSIDAQYAEAERVMRLCGLEGKLPLYKGANASFESILPQINTANFDGSEAVNFLINEAKSKAENKLTIIAVGKLTNVALAISKDPEFARRIRLVWLGSNYPEPGEYNLENDTSALNVVLKSDIPFEIVTVRYGKATGSAAVKILQEEVRKRMPGIGPKTKVPVSGRHGGTFTSFGDYSVNLFEHINYDGDPPARSLFDMVAVAIVKNPEWGMKSQVPAALYIGNMWKSTPQPDRTLTIWENFDKAGILNDFHRTLTDYELVALKDEQ